MGPAVLSEVSLPRVHWIHGVSGKSGNNLWAQSVAGKILISKSLGGVVVAKGVPDWDQMQIAGTHHGSAMIARFTWGTQSQMSHRGVENLGNEFEASCGYWGTSSRRGNARARESLFSPRWGLQHLLRPPTHSLRCGLHSFAASRLT